MDTSPPDTLFVEKPPLQTNSRAATFTFTGVDNGTPAPFLEYECRLDSRDPDMWLECFNPTFYSNLTTGSHTLEVRALDGNENYDPTPARYTWNVGVPANCDQANVTLTPTADGWVDEVNPVESFLFDQELEVRSGADGDPTAVPPEPVDRPERAHADPLPGADGRHRLRARVGHAAAVRRRHDRGPHARGAAARGLVPREHAHLDQPARHARRRRRPRRQAGEGYREWDVKAHVEAMIEGGVSHGWQIRDSHESDPDGGDQSFASRETPQDPPEITLPELKLRYEPDTTTPGAGAAAAPARHAADDRALRPGPDREHARRQRPRQLPR